MTINWITLSRNIKSFIGESFRVFLRLSSNPPLVYLPVESVFVNLDSVYFIILSQVHQAAR